MFLCFSVLQSMLLSRGEKSNELLYIEKAKLRDLENFGPKRLKELIDAEVKRCLYKLGIDAIKPDLIRKVQYAVKFIEFTLQNRE